MDLFYKLAIITFVTCVAAWQYVTVTLSTCWDCTGRTAEIVAGVIHAPFRYRPLTPTILVTMGNTVQAHALFHLVMLFVFFWLLWGWAERWRGNGALAVALATVALSVMWPTYYFSSYTITEWVLWLSGLMLLTGRWLSLEPRTAK